MTATVVKKQYFITIVGTAQEILDALALNDNPMPVIGNYNAADSKWYILAKKGGI